MALFAVGVGGLIVLLRIPAQSALGPTSPFILSWPAAMLAAFIGGFWPTVVVAILGLWVGQWALETGGSPHLGPGGIVIYVAFCLVFAVAGGLRKRGLRRTAADAERLRDMQRRLTGVARLNAMGEIAATLAHELNQPLTAIASYAGAAQNLVERDPTQGAAVSELLDKVTAQASRARDIIRRIRAHVTQGELILDSHPLPEMFEEALALALAAANGSTVAVRRDFEAAGAVLADRVQLQQVMVNLIRNAMEAMAEASRRELAIGGRVGTEGLVEAFVSDTGPGVAPDVAERLFEPFVTGKAEGMGIGLSVSRGIIEAHGGEIWMDTNPNGGAIFRFTLRQAPMEAPS